MRLNARALCRIAPLITAALLLSACETVFVKPLPVPAGAKPDERLLGKWISESEADHGAYVQFDSGANNEINVSGLGDEPGDRKPFFTLVTKRIRQNDFMCLTTTDKSRGEGYLLARYSVEGDELIVWTLDQEKMNVAIKQRKLKGTVGQGVQDTVISDTPENVVKFLEAAENDLYKEMVRLRKSKEKPPTEPRADARL